jgi:hypothetical protein
MRANGHRAVAGAGAAGWHHVVGETFYDNRWHFLDLDVRAAFRRADGRPASMAAAQREDALWNQPERRLFFPLDPIDKVRDVYRNTPVHHYYDQRREWL